MDIASNGRRTFIRSAGAVAAASLFGGRYLRQAAASDHAMTGRGGADGYVVEAALTRHCATCEFWGGPRRVSADGTSITVTGLGWCNNPKSPNHQKLTSPDHGPMDAWKKWSVLG